ncbi:dehydrogenase [Mycena maculata]|uniref:Dehydrogenase n=1 Tax=Mycena maculata TaxID=230809 RepID=A0AAD7HT03_9AGAR|nr:dehydrogenase [Mycena maculata]
MAQDLDSPVFLITGCSTGLGRELVLAVLADGFRVIATARRVETLIEVENLGAKILGLDVTWSVQDLAAFAAKATAIYGQVDYLINNAGFGQAGAIEEVSHEEALRQFNTNFFGLVNTTSAFLPHFRGRRAGTLVHISSEVTSTAVPGIGIYTASKAAVDAVSDTWAHELAEYGIRSISVQPGAFRTSFYKDESARTAEAKIEGYAVAHGTLDFMATQFAANLPGDPAKAAHNIIKLVTKHELPLRFVVGEDAFADFKKFYERRLEEMEAARDLSMGTNFDV